MKKNLIQQVRELVKNKKREMDRNEKSDIFRLHCDICGDTKVKMTGIDFEQWEKDLFDKNHVHKIRRFLKEVKKKWQMKK